ncbi:hypothetical protein AFCDBAGC_4825 [Methylobacterium cerastii]|uniref:Hedgehog/Intein (Hint) domain-containing protein n=1 Tax=Methylobacterium cerastii TaxID=932741 RepID=A0ABQ4QPX7_9HYPH|nr:hypothetical protein [Methylobacterium cerastii]GJD46940.1 hypothetical protein AFCDBAGC_4825 [Methylobacterium cerastii]
MTASFDRKGPSTRYNARIFRLGADWVLCSFCLPTSMPIPLEVIAPDNVTLETWAFAGMTARERRPTGLLLLRTRGDAAETVFARGTSLVVATHFHSITLATGPAEPAGTLSPGDAAVMARAVLSSMTPRNAAALADPITLLAPAIRDLPVPKDGPVVTLVDDPLACSISGTEVPNYVLFDSGPGLRCARVATARMTFSPVSRMDLELDPLWGPEVGQPERAFLIANGGFAAARLSAAAR